MQKKIFLLLTVVLAIIQCNSPPPMPEKPDLAPVKPVVDEYWGVDLTDPYQYMENMEDSLVRNWMIANADYAKAVLDGISGRQGLLDKMKEFDERVSDRITNLIILDNDRYFYLKTTPEDETGKLYTREGYKGEERMLFDPQTYNDDSLDYVIGSISPTFEGAKVAFSLQPNGTENTITKIMNVESGEFFPEELTLSFGGNSWLADGEHFLYTKINSEDVHDPARFIYPKSYIHRVGTSQEDDPLFFSAGKYPEMGIEPAELPIAFYDQYADHLFIGFFNVEHYMTIFVADGKEVFDDSVNWSQVCSKKDEIQNFYPMNDRLFVFTAKGALNYKVLETDLWAPDFLNAKEFIPEPGDGILDNFSFTNDACFFTVKSNGTSTRLFRKEMQGDIAEVKLPVAAGSVGLRTKGYKFPDVWVGLTGWTLDGKRFRYLAEEKSFVPEPLSEKAEYPEFNDLVVEELMVPSYDGVEVPLSLIYRKGLIKDGSTPVMISGYGSYGISNNPGFNANRMLWPYHGGIWAVAHVRGGGALGEAWRLAGYKTNKPNTWKDLIAVTEYLHEQGYSSPEHTAIIGGSAGGILIGRAMTDRPDLFKAALPLVGSMNTVRMEQSPNGPTNVPEFGTVKDSVEFFALLEMDSYQHLEEGVAYPATLVTAGFNDPRVIAWQPAKFAARLQEVNASHNPILFWVDYKSGHGIGNTKTKDWEDLADYMAFAFWQTGHSNFQR